MLATRPWVSPVSARRVAELAAQAAAKEPVAVAKRLEELVARNRTIHEVECVNLNPASNVMNPRAEAMLSAGLGTRASLGYPGEKYETGVEALEEIEVIAAARA